MGGAVFDPGIVAMAEAIEASGADSISLSDHVLSFSRRDDRIDARSLEIWLEVLTCLGCDVERWLAHRCGCRCNHLAPFGEVNVQGIWDAGLEPGTDAIRRIQRVLDW